MKNNHGKEFTLILQQYPPLYRSIIVTVMCTSTHQVIALPSLNSSDHTNLSFIKIWTQAHLPAQSPVKVGPNISKYIWALSESCLSYDLAKLQTQMSFEEVLLHSECFIQAWNLMGWSLVGGFFPYTSDESYLLDLLANPHRFQAEMFLCYCSSLTCNTTTEAADCLETPGVRDGAPGIVTWLVC